VTITTVILEDRFCFRVISLRSSPSRDGFEFCAVLPVFSIHVSDLREEVCLGKKARGFGPTTLAVKSPLLSKKCCAIGGYLFV